jgi:anti-anti-sigma factor
MTTQPAPMTRVRVDQAKTGNLSDLTVLRFSGDITGTSNEAVFGAYRQVPADTRKLVLDFTKVEYINSSGIALLIELLMAAQKDNRTVRSFGLSPHFQKVFMMVGLNQYTHHYPDENSACAAW